MTDYAGWEREGRTGCFAVLKNVLFPVLLIFRTLHSTPLRCVSATTGEMPGCVLRPNSAYQWCRVGQSDDRQSSQPGASGGGEGRFRTCACIKPILRIIINSELTLLTPTATQVGLTLSTSLSDQTLLVIQSRPVIQILIHSLPLGWYPETCDRVWIKMNILTNCWPIKSLT